MTPEQKDLLLKDLCARLPYGVKIAVDNEVEILEGVSALDAYVEYDSLFSSDIEDIKPYLFPMSSMTEEQWIDTPYANLNKFTFDSFKCGCSILAFETYEVNLSYVVEFINWCYKNHFDIYGLIPMGLAIDATGLNIY